MIFKQILIPDSENHTIEMPKSFYGKKVEVVVKEVEDAGKKTIPVPPTGKVTSKEEILEIFGKGKDFPSIEEIRKRVWPSKW